MKISALPSSKDIGQDDEMIVNSAAEGTVRTQLKNVQIGTYYSVTIKKDGWIGDKAPYSQKITNSELREDFQYSICMNLDAYKNSSTEPKDYYKAFSRLAMGYAETGDGYATFYVWKKPAIDLTVNLVS